MFKILVTHLLERFGSCFLEVDKSCVRRAASSVDAEFGAKMKLCVGARLGTDFGKV